MLDLALVRPLIQSALKEDIGRGDITSEAIISSPSCAKAEIVAEEEGILAGVELAREVFRLVSSGKVEFSYSLKDRDILVKGEPILIIKSETLNILKGERIALNFLSHLCGIATLTKKYVDLASPFKVKILDTRKTTPNLRLLEKYAVKMGGGFNHRFALDDGILIKDNHLKASGGVKEAVARVRRGLSPFRKIEVEAAGLSQVEEALAAKVDIIMLDNMSIEEIKKAVKLIRASNKETLIEVSGGVNLASVVEIARTKVDLISVGELTHSARSAKMSLNLMES
jgi:nicotinate-nucleotide pyrophosphorylase (carboxylating)